MPAGSTTKAKTLPAFKLRRRRWAQRQIAHVAIMLQLRLFIGFLLLFGVYRFSLRLGGHTLVWLHKLCSFDNGAPASRSVSILAGKSRRSIFVYTGTPRPTLFPARTGIAAGARRLVLPPPLFPRVIKFPHDTKTTSRFHNSTGSSLFETGNSFPETLQPQFQTQAQPEKGAVLRPIRAKG